MREDSDESACIAKESCPSCGSRDNLGRYSDGHGYCFGCGHYELGDGTTSNTERRHKVEGLLPFGRYKDLTKRGIREDTCQRFGYYIGEDTYGNTVQIAPYRSVTGGDICGQKLRGANKKFSTTGDFDDVALFGQHLWKRGGRQIVITEGEIDCLSVAQVMPTWPVVSLPNGAKGAVKAIKRNLEFLQTYEKVILMFDMDEPGRAAAKECVDLFTPGTCAIAEFALKDANEMLVAGRVKELTTAVWEAQIARPDGIVNGADLWAGISKPVVMGSPYPWVSLNNILYGSRPGEIVTWGAGSGVGKSALVAEVTYSRLISGMKVGYIALEEGVDRTGRRFVGMHLNKPIHLPGQNVSDEDLKRAFDETLGRGNFWTYDHFGSVDGEHLLNKMRYLVVGCGVERIVLDHVSIVVSGGGSDSDERKDLDRLMTNLRTFTENTDVGMDLVSHLKRPDGTAHEDGGQISLGHFRGSASIAQLSDIVIGAERNQQAETEEDKNTTRLRIVKNRYTGETGLAGSLLYNKTTGRLTEVDPWADTETSDSGSEDY